MLRQDDVQSSSAAEQILTLLTGIPLSRISVRMYVRTVAVVPSVEYLQIHDW